MDRAMMAPSVHLSLQRRLDDHRSIFRLQRWSVRCASERQALFSRIAPVYDNVCLFPLILLGNGLISLFRFLNYFVGF